MKGQNMIGYGVTQARLQSKGDDMLLVGNVERARIRLEMIKVMQKLYINLPYHNFGHAMAIALRAESIARKCNEEGVPADTLVVFSAGLGHDAGYHLNPKKYGFATREAHSAILTTQALIAIHAPMEIIKPVDAAIIATHKDAAFTTVEQKIVRAADLSNFGGPYEGFLKGTFLFKHEQEMLGGRLIPWDEWKQQTHDVAEFYCSQDIHLTSAYANPDGTSQFHTDTRANVARLLDEDNDVLESFFLAQIKN